MIRSIARYLRALLCAPLILESVMTTVAEITQRLDAVNEKLQKVGNESAKTVQAVADLKAQIEAMQQAGQDVPAELVAAVERVEASVAAVDELVPDAQPEGGAVT